MAKNLLSHTRSRLTPCRQRLYANTMRTTLFDGCKHTIAGLASFLAQLPLCYISVCCATAHRLRGVCYSECNSCLPRALIAHFGLANCPAAYHGLKIITSLRLRFPDFQRRMPIIIIFSYFYKSSISPVDNPVALIMISIATSCCFNTFATSSLPFASPLTKPSPNEVSMTFLTSQ